MLITGLISQQGEARSKGSSKEWVAKKEKSKSLLTVHNRLEGPAVPGNPSQQYKCSGFAHVLSYKMAPERLALSPPWPVRPFKASEAHRVGTSVPGRKKRQHEKAGHPVMGIWQPLKNVRSQICVPGVLSPCPHENIER